MRAGGPMRLSGAVTTVAPGRLRQRRAEALSRAVGARPAASSSTDEEAA